MAKISEFVLGGEAFCLMAYHDDEKKRNVYSVKLLDNDRPMSFEELLDLVGQMHRDMNGMFYRWQNGSIDNDLVNRMEGEWKKREETDAHEA